MDGCKDEDEISRLLNSTTTVLGNHLYHEAALRGNCESGVLLLLPVRLFPKLPLTLLLILFTLASTLLTTARPPFSHTDEIIDLLLDQPNFECDPINRIEGDTPLHSAVRWVNSLPRAPAAGDDDSGPGLDVIDMMLEAGSNPRVKNRGGLTAWALADPGNKALRDLIAKHEYMALNKGDLVESGAGGGGGALFDGVEEEAFDEDAEFSGSDDDERAEFYRRKTAFLARRR